MGLQGSEILCQIGISHKMVFAVCRVNVPANNNNGFKKILEHTGPGYHFVMEATGVYYIRLAFWLHEQGCNLSVVNALSIKRYIQMHLERNKSDKKDAAWICRYAIGQRPAYWEMPDGAYFECKQLYNTIREYAEQIKRFNNQLHSLKLLPVPSKDTIWSLEKMKGHLA